ncbi:hypothetical protein HDU87_003718 [Geranomyces variabilis]|uniref:RRM domain-containing protein n=1 Tax=Geranomyces variabilis TaxID=109894 RepID=A0AAD5XSD1_9FUNG|nr:hypothetical protein HDU87_003718 [Geranomyces variabilis]
MSHQPKTTIHVTNITKDKAALKRMFQEMEGFRRISFHQDYCFVCFDDLSSATKAIDQIHSQTDMLAAYAKHGVASATTPTIVVPSSRILYVSLFSYFTESELTRIFRMYEGFDRFRDMECSKIALEDLNSTTNLFANYSTKGAKQSNGRSRRGTTGTAPVSAGSLSTSAARNNGAGPPTAAEKDTESTHPRRELSGSLAGAGQPKRTIHVTNIDNDKASILDLFSKFEGFQRVAFYADYCFVCFDDTRAASKAIEELLFKTTMKANFAKADFIPHVIPPASIGHPNHIVRVSDYPSNTSEQDLVRVLERYEGFCDIHFYHASCLAHYADQPCARRALEGINENTNFTAIYSKKGVGSRGRHARTSGRGSAAQQQQQQQQQQSIGSGRTASPSRLSVAIQAEEVNPISPPSQASPNSSGRGGDGSSSSPRASPSPSAGEIPRQHGGNEEDEKDSEDNENDNGSEPRQAEDSDGTDEDAEQSDEESGLFAQPEHAAAAEMRDGEEIDNDSAGDQSHPSSRVVFDEAERLITQDPFAQHDRNESTSQVNTVPANHPPPQPSQTQMDPTPAATRTHHSEVHKHMHFAANFTHQHFHMVPPPPQQQPPQHLQQHHRINLESMPVGGGGLVQPYSGDMEMDFKRQNGALGTSMLPYSLATANRAAAAQETAGHRADAGTTIAGPGIVSSHHYDHGALLLEKANVENQLVAAKSFIDDLFAQYMHLEQENRMLRQSHHQHQQFAPSQLTFPPGQQQQAHQEQQQHSYHIGGPSPAGVSPAAHAQQQQLSPIDRSALSAASSTSSHLAPGESGSAGDASGATSSVSHIPTTGSASHARSSSSSSWPPKPQHQHDPHQYQQQALHRHPTQQQPHPLPPPPQHSQQQQQQQPQEQDPHAQATATSLPAIQKQQQQQQQREQQDTAATVDALRREVARLHERLRKRDVEYARLDAAHKSCGVLQGLLAMCE